MNIENQYVSKWERITDIVFPEDLTEQERKQMEENADRTELYTFLYSTKDGSDVRGYAIVPNGQHEEHSLPGILYARGGYGDLGRISHYLLLTTLAELAGKGYVVLATDYRDKSKSPDDEVIDLLSLRDVATTLPIVDEEKLVLMGVSRGGLVVYRALPNADWVKAAVSIAGIANLEAAVQRRPEAQKLLTEYYGEDLARYSVLRKPERLPDTPLLLLHGEDDQRVNVQDSQKLAAALQGLGRPVNLIVYPGATHYLEEVESQYLANIDTWLKKHL